MEKIYVETLSKLESKPVIQSVFQMFYDYFCNWEETKDDTEEHHVKAALLCTAKHLNIREVLDIQKEGCKKIDDLFE